MTMAETHDWLILRCRVSLAGRVTAGGGSVASGGVLRLTAMPAASRHHTRSRTHEVLRRYSTQIRSDGFYFFLDLPAGEYVLDGEDEQGDAIEAQRISIPAASSAGPAPVVSADLIVPPKSRADDRRREAKTPAVPVKRRRGSRNVPTE